MATVICMASVKGGSGKTVLSATFGALLAAMGKRVLLVDTDAATNGLSLLYLDETLAAREAGERVGTPIFGTFEIPRSASADARFVHLPTGVELLPATMGFFNTEEVAPDLHEERLSSALGEWRDDFDYIILDAQAGSDVYAAVSMKLADRVVIVSEYDPLSAAGVERLKAIYPKALAYERTWVLLNKMLPELVQSYSDFMEVARYLRPIPWDAAVVRAYSRRSLALDLEHGNEHTIAVIGTLRSLLPPGDAAELDAWVQQRAVELRAPLREQADDLAEQLKGLDRLEHELVERRGISEVIASGTMVVIAVAVSVAAINTVIAAGLGALAGAGLLIMLRWPSRHDRGRRRRSDLARRRTRLEAQLARLETLASLQDEELISARSGAKDPAGPHAPSGTPRYVRAPGGNAWHWCRNCSLYPNVIGELRAERPRDELCAECASKERAYHCRA